MLRWTLAALHLTALGFGLGAVWVRARALRGPFDPAGLHRVFAADSWWALAGALWIGILGDRSLVRFDPETKKVTDTIPLGG